MFDVVSEYSKLNGAIQVWKAWRDKMLEQRREVKPVYLSLPIPQRDVELDAAIAYAVLDDFLAWAESHHGLCLTFVEGKAIEH